jgi:hypothetical protein
MGSAASGRQENYSVVCEYVCITTPFLKRLRKKKAYGSVVVKALCYKPEGRGFKTR